MNLPPKKLIETIIPLDAINEASAREKSIRHGHPSTLHLWWARRPLAAARAVIFAQMVNDPLEKYGDNPTPQQKSAATKKRNELFKIIEDLVVWENTNNQDVLNRARAAIKESWRETCEAYHNAPGFDPDKLPAFHDPFSGGGAIPLEAQRLGLESWASDLNPVPVMINKAMIEIPPRFSEHQPIGPVPFGENVSTVEYTKAGGLAEDVRRYGLWMRAEAKRRMGHLYPEVVVTHEMAKSRSDLEQYVGRKLTVIAWLWARTVKSPNPKFSHIDVPLVSNFILSNKKGHEIWLDPIVNDTSWHFELRVGTPPKGAEHGTKLARGAKFKCLMSNISIEEDYVRSEAKSKRMGRSLLAIVCEGDRGRVYLPGNEVHVKIADSAYPEWRPDVLMPQNPRWFSPPAYGMNTYGDLFTDRQLVALNTFADMVNVVRRKAIDDAIAAGMSDDGISVSEGGTGATAFGDAMAVYMTFIIDKCTDYNNSICDWINCGDKVGHLFSRQAIPMKWDYAEINPFCLSTANMQAMVYWVYEALQGMPATPIGHVEQCDAQSQEFSRSKVISTDPPYYDNIGYADLSDFFYIWMRRGLKDVFPTVFPTVATPKMEELVATPYRHGGQEKAEQFFLDGMTTAMHNLCRMSHEGFPVTIYYAFKQSESGASGTSNTGWETFLEAVVQAGFVLSGTWPMRTERQGRMIGMGTNALASSLVLVCRKRAKNAPEIEKREFLYELSQTMPRALHTMQGLDGEIAPIAPVDLAQAAIGPGMEVFSRYSRVLNSDGSRMSVHDAIIEINRYLGSGDFDKATNVCVKLFESHGWSDMPYAEAEGFCLGQGTSVGHIVDSSVLKANAGRAQLVHWQDYPREYDPAADKNRPIWEATHHLVRAIQQEGETAAGTLLARMPEAAESVRSLAYTLYTLCERRGFADDARAYNALITSWNQVQMEQMKVSADNGLRQGDLFE